MSDAEVKDLNQISKKDIYHTPSGKYIQFIHDHSKKTFDAWELLPDGSHRLLESQSTTIETFDEFKEKIATISENAVGDACTGSNPRTIDPATMERMFTCIYYGTEVDF